jgi:DNA-binding NarL/FixJ family response regulator
VVNQDLTVVMADDHPRLRDHVRKALELGGCRVLGVGATADDAVRLVLDLKPDVALLDIHMPGNGISAARRIAEGAPATAIVMLTQSADDDDLFDSLRAGASGYLLKAMEPATLADKLRGVLDGEAAMPPKLVARVLDDFREPARRLSRRPAAASRLSSREWEVMELLRSGKTTDEVAKQLFLSPTTVRVHVSSVLRKLAVKDRESAFKLLRGR